MATIEQLTQQLVSVNENQNDTAKETKKEISDLSFCNLFLVSVIAL